MCIKESMTNNQYNQNFMTFTLSCLCRTSSSPRMPPLTSRLFLDSPKGVSCRLTRVSWPLPHGMSFSNYDVCCLCRCLVVPPPRYQVPQCLLLLSPWPFAVLPGVLLICWGYWGVPAPFAPVSISYVGIKTELFISCCFRALWKPFLSILVAPVSVMMGLWGWAVGAA